MQTEVVLDDFKFIFYLNGFSIFQDDKVIGYECGYINRYRRGMYDLAHVYEIVQEIGAYRASYFTVSDSKVLTIETDNYIVEIVVSSLGCDLRTIKITNRKTKYYLAIHFPNLDLEYGRGTAKVINSKLNTPELIEELALNIEHIR